MSSDELSRPNLTIHALRELWRADRPAAASVWMRHAAGAALRAVRAVHLPSDVADDIAGQTALLLCDASSSFARARPDTPLDAWLGAVCRHLAKSELRRRDRNRRPAADPSRMAAARRRRAARRAHRLERVALGARARLTPPQNAALELHLEGWTYEAVGSELGVRASSARERIARAWKRLEQPGPNPRLSPERLRGANLFLLLPRQRRLYDARANGDSYRVIATREQMTIGSVRSALHRSRDRVTDVRALRMGRP